MTWARRSRTTAPIWCGACAPGTASSAPSCGSTRPCIWTWTICSRSSTASKNESAGRSKQFGSLLDDEPAPPVDFSDLRAKYLRRGLDASGGEAASARFSSAKKHLTLLLIEGGNFATGADQSRLLLAQVKQDIASLGGTDRYAPGMRVGFTGDVAVSVEEISGLETDLTSSSIVW